MRIGKISRPPSHELFVSFTSIFSIRFFSDPPPIYETMSQNMQFFYGIPKLNITKYYALAHACFTEFKLGLQQLPLNVPMQWIVCLRVQTNLILSFQSLPVCETTDVFLIQEAYNVWSQLKILSSIQSNLYLCKLWILDIVLDKIK